MKKQYIVPAIYGHTLRIESQILAASPRVLKEQAFGTLYKNQTLNKEKPDYEKLYIYSSDEMQGVEGDDIRTY